MTDNKPYPPSERKKRKAWKSGDLVKSREVTGIWVTAAGITGLTIIGKVVFHFISVFFQRTFGDPKDFQSNNMLVSAGTLVTQTGVSMLGLFVLLGFVALIGEYSQIGSKGFGAENLLRWQRVNPVENAKRWFRLQTWMDAIRGFILLVFLLGTLFLLVQDLFTRELAKDLFVTDNSARFVERKLLTIGSILLFMGGCSAFLDFLLLRISWRKRNSLSREELKEEMNESEGNPEVKSMRRHLQGEWLAQSEIEGVRRSRVVIVQRMGERERTGP